MCCILEAMSNHQPGTYVKGDRTRICQSPSEAVAAVFEGFKLVEAPTEAPTKAPAEVNEVRTLGDNEPISSYPVAVDSEASTETSDTSSDLPETDEEVDADDAANTYSF